MYDALVPRDARLRSLHKKKCIFTHGTSKVGSANQIRMKTQCITLRLEDFTCIFYSNDLSRCKTDNRSFLIIIPLSAINQITVLLVFQKNHIKTEVCRICRIGFAFERFITLTSGCKVSTPSISSYSVMVSKFNNSVFIGRYLIRKITKKV